MNFEEKINRVGTHSMKWDGMSDMYGVRPEDGISMWVADMDFRPPAAVVERLQERLDHGVFGYFVGAEGYTNALANWLKTRHGFIANPAHMLQTAGLVQGVAVALNALTEKGDGVITFNPVYHAFGRTIRAMERDPIESPLVLKDGLYQMDLDGLEANLKGHEKVIILCSPHNPGGRVWTVEELRALGEFALRNHLYIISDEIHMDIVFSGHKHHVFGNAFSELDDHLVYLFSATKTFNIAGALTGTVYSPSASMNAKMQSAAMAMGIGINLFGIIACEAAYRDGATWCDEMVAYIEKNAQIMHEGLNNIPGVVSMPLQSTYLSWADFRGLGLSSEELHSRVYKEAKIAANQGPTFGTGGDGHLRFNVATTRDNVLEAVERLQNAFKDVQ